MEGNKKFRLNVPEQDLAEFTLFPPNVAAALGWAEALPVTDSSAVVELLREALEQLNRYPLTAEARFDILEALRPHLDIALSNLTRRYLNQPLVLPAEPYSAAQASGELYSLASTAYTIAAIDAIRGHDSIRDTNPARLACASIHRALIYAGRKVLQSLQLFRPVPIHGWESMHQLYALAEHQELSDLPVPQSNGGAATIRCAYLQPLLLSCCKTNHLRQTDLDAVFNAAAQWGDSVRIHAPDAGEGLFLVDLDSDQPPLYRSLYSGQPAANCRMLDTMALVRQLKLEKNQSRNTYNLPGVVLVHLIKSLGSTRTRNFHRSPSDSVMMVCMGLSSTHYHVANQRSFEQLLYGDTTRPTVVAGLQTNQFLDGANDAESRRPDQQRYPVYRVKLADASPGGYCLDWAEELPADVKSGDIVGLKDATSADWSIAVIRWLHQAEDTDTLIGLELLSPRAIAYGAIIQRKDGAETPPMRTLLLPEIKLVGQPESLITPRTGFKEQQKLTLLNSAEEYAVQLQRQVASSGSFARFEFRHTRELGDVLAENQDVKLGTAYDSLWSNI